MHICSLLEKDTESPLKLNFNVSSHPDTSEDKIDGKVFQVQLRDRNNVKLFTGLWPRHEYTASVCKFCASSYFTHLV